MFWRNRMQPASRFVLCSLCIAAAVLAPCLGQSPPNPPQRFVFYHLDHLGSPRLILDETGATVSTHHYLAFGEELPAPASPDPTMNRKAFTGHERDSESGLDYMLARYYSSSLSRFMSVDPSKKSINPVDPQSWNRYTYGANNPIRYTDPDGKHNEEGHTKITNGALKDKMSSEALEEVVKGNLDVDKNQGTTAADANQHGMAGTKPDGTMQTPGEATVGTAAVVAAAIESGASALLDGDVSGARTQFGAATHAVQDYDAGSHEGAPWRGFGGTAARDPVGGIVHAIDDSVLLPGEAIRGREATSALHSRFEGAVRSAGEARGLSDAAISDALSKFNGK